MSAPRLVVLALVLAGCGSATDEPPSTGGASTSGEVPSAEAFAAQSEAPTVTPTSEGAPTSEDATPEAAGARPSALDTATACARAHPCCEAFVAAVDDPVEIERARIACEQLDHLEQLGDAAGEACLAALDGWRRALELDHREVPTACR